MTKRNLPCPDCIEMGRDDKGDNLFLLDDGETYICRSTHHKRKFYTYVDDRIVINNNGNSVKDTMETIKEYPIFTGDYRGIKGSTFESFKVKVSVDSQRGEPEFLFFPIYSSDNNLIGYHRRGVKDKSFLNVGGIKGKTTGLFKEPAVPRSKFVAITEGHLDCLSLYQALKDRYPNNSPNIRSVNNGVGDFKSIANEVEDLKAYEKVILCFDNDDPGKTFSSEVSKLLGSKAYVMKLSSYKDANEALLDGSAKLLVSNFFEADIYKPSGVVSLASLGDAIVHKAKWGLEYPFHRLTEMTYGIRKGEIISIGAGAGVGKSSFIIELIKSLVFVHKEKVGIFSLEETPEITGKKLIGSIINKKIHLPDCTYDESEVRRVINELDGRIYLYDHQGYIDWKNIESVMRFQASIGVSFFVIDPITALSAHLSASETNEVLNGMAADLSTLVHSLGITVFLVSHLNNSKKTKSHDEGGRVYGSDFAGSRALYRWSHLMFGLSRNVISDDEEIRNTVLLQVIKNRYSGETGSFSLKYNTSKGVLEEIEGTFVEEEEDVDYAF